MEGVIEYSSDQLTIIMSLTKSPAQGDNSNNNSTNNNHDGYTISQGNDNHVSTQESFDAEVMSLKAVELLLLSTVEVGSPLHSGSLYPYHRYYPI